MKGATTPNQKTTSITTTTIKVSTNETACQKRQLLRRFTINTRYTKAIKITTMCISKFMRSFPSKRLHYVWTRSVTQHTRLHYVWTRSVTQHNRLHDVWTRSVTQHNRLHCLWTRSVTQHKRLHYVWTRSVTQHYYIMCGLGV
ncbi:hypothetical protein DPMN_136305 [Dreissena polymorpha]|uniref:Uncharacterized protein n=1 Tax=Dreissena polymorpha TaxID=45954 RepID=A0A9D4G0K6_DREPO|nr:hypothetical protein DPMN_136275 [Dreissena polymorpha]KAH3807957.1 hypothetical protein DPMN_136305 [Dreissena polymorpha]